MPKICYVLLLNILWPVILPAQTSAPLDQLISRSESLLNQEPKVSLGLAIQAKALAEKNNDKKNLAAALSLMGVANYKVDKYDTAMIFMNRSAAISREIKDTSIQAFCSYWMANLELYKGQYVKALNLYESGYALADKCNDKKDIARCLDGEASIYESLNEDSNALEFYLKSLAVAKQAQFKDWYGGVTYSLAKLLDKKGQTEQAINKFNEAISLSEQTNNLNNEATCYQELAYIYYYKKKDSQAAIKYIKKAMDIFLQTGSELSFGFSRLLMSTLLIDDKEYDLAIRMATGSLEDGQASGETQLQKNAAEVLYYAYSRKGDMAKALEYHVLFHRLSEIDKERQLVEELTKNELTTNFNNERELIKAREEQHDAEMKVQIQKQKFAQQTSIGIIILVSIIALIAIYAFLEKRKDNKVIATEKEKSDQLLLNILPSQIASELKENGFAKARNYSLATVLFADIKNFTRAAELMSPEKLVAEIDHYFGNFDQIIAKYNIEKIKTIGDAYLCVGGLPVADENNAVYVVSAAIELQKFMASLKEVKAKNNEIYFEIRVGIHTGPLVAGIVGLKKFAYDIWGDTVNVAARMEQYGEEGKINISGATYQLIKDHFACTYRGKIEAKNKGQIDMYFVENKIV